MPYFNIVAQTTENTVVTEYEPAKTRSSNYQSEAALEKEFIHMLQSRAMNILKFIMKKILSQTCVLSLKSSMTIILLKTNGKDFSRIQ